MLDAEMREAISTALLFFEELVGCVAGCGCFVDLEPPWDASARVEAFAREGFRAWDPGISPEDVLFALEWCFEFLEDADVAEVSERLGLHFGSAADFRRFFAPAARELAESLPRVAASP